MVFLSGVQEEFILEALPLLGTDWGGENPVEHSALIRATLMERYYESGDAMAEVRIANLR